MAFLPFNAIAKEDSGDLLAKAFNALDKADLVTAKHYAEKISNPVGKTLITWKRLRRGNGAWGEYVDFLVENPDWPGLQRLRSRGEAAIPPNHNPTQVRAYFKDQLPQTGSGSLRLAEAFTAQGRGADAKAEAKRAWLSLTLQQHEMNSLLHRYSGSLSRYHQKRLEFLLWNGHTNEASRMLALVSPGQQKLAKARSHCKKPPKASMH
jgi:soluble lytic murein transglycosylase